MKEISQETAVELLEALKEAKETIRALHNCTLIGRTMDDNIQRAWIIYNDKSPEMKKINTAILKAERKE